MTGQDRVRQDEETRLGEEYMHTCIHALVPVGLSSAREGHGKEMSKCQNALTRACQGEGMVPPITQQSPSAIDGAMASGMRELGAKLKAVKRVPGAEL